jgi:hypothetical protein
MADAKREAVSELEGWFSARGHRLEFELAPTPGRWIAVVLPHSGPMGSGATLAARGSTQLDAANSAKQALLSSPWKDRPKHVGL